MSLFCYSFSYFYYAKIYILNSHDKNVSMDKEDSQQK
jgi:hypothetical protein